MALRTHGTLVAATVATVTITRPPGPAFAGVDANGAATSRTLERVIANVQVLNRDGADEIYFTVDGSTPVVGAEDNFVLPAAISARTEAVAEDDTVVVKLISAGTPTYSIEAII